MEVEVGFALDDPSGPDTGLPVFAVVPCWQTPEWSSKTDFSPKTGPLIEAVFQLQEKGLSRLQILKTWVERNVQPTGMTEFPMYEYQGLGDPSRLLRRELSESEFEDRLHLLTGLPLGEIHMWGLHGSLQPSESAASDKSSTSATFVLCMRRPPLCFILTLRHRFSSFG